MPSLAFGGDRDSSPVMDSIALALFQHRPQFDLQSEESFVLLYNEIKSE